VNAAMNVLVPWKAENFLLTGRLLASQRGLHFTELGR
jgi:hypothetical protein